MKPPKQFLAFEPHWYVLDGEAVVPVAGMQQWGEWFEKSNPRVDYTEVTDTCSVSTIFLGLDNRLYGKGPPIVFETMIFGAPESIDRRQWRYSSWDDAVIGHKAAVRKCRAALGQEVGQ